MVAVRVDPVNDAPVAGDDTAVVQAGTARVLLHASLLANDTDIDGDPLTLIAAQNPVHGTVVRDAVRVTFTPEPGYTGPASFQYVAGDGTATAIATVQITVQLGPVCGDGLVVSPETCDDGNTSFDDGCSDECASEPGWSCTGQPSTCTTICGDGSVVGASSATTATPTRPTAAPRGASTAWSATPRRSPAARGSRSIRIPATATWATRTTGRSTPPRRRRARRSPQTELSFDPM